MASVSQQPDKQLERVLETVFAARKYGSVHPGWHAQSPQLNWLRAAP